MHGRSWLAVASAAAVSCAHVPRQPLSPSDYPGTLVRPEAVSGDFLRRQLIVFRAHRWTRSFDAVLQKKGDRLIFMGLTPFGSKAFVLEQSGTTVTFTRYLIKKLPFPPEFMLNDIQRTYFRSISQEQLADGWHELQRDGERIREHWEGGHLLRRTFERLDRKPAGVITIDYAGSVDGTRAPAVIELDNGWFGYHLTIRTVVAEPL